MITVISDVCDGVRNYSLTLYSKGTHDLLSRQKMSIFSTFFKKIFNSYAHVSVDNDTMKIQKEI